jgi:hypothetical protein
MSFFKFLLFSVIIGTVLSLQTSEFAGSVTVGFAIGVLLSAAVVTLSRYFCFEREAKNDTAEKKETPTTTKEFASVGLPPPPPPPSSIVSEDETTVTGRPITLHEASLFDPGQREISSKKRKEKKMQQRRSFLSTEL